MRGKNEDYAKDSDPYSNFRFAAQAAGITTEQGILYLIGVKLARLENLISVPDEQVNNESLDDTIMDLTNYAGILKAYRRLKNAPDPTYAYAPAGEPGDEPEYGFNLNPEGEEEEPQPEASRPSTMDKLRSLLKR
jgi:hypothetical protein